MFVGTNSDSRRYVRIEPDIRHAELELRNLGLEGSKAKPLTTPGFKVDEKELASGRTPPHGDGSMYSQANVREESVLRPPARALPSVIVDIEKVLREADGSVKLVVVRPHTDGKVFARGAPQNRTVRARRNPKNTSVYPSEIGRCSQIVENSKIGMSRHLDSSTTTQMAKIMVQYGRSSRSS